MKARRKFTTAIAIYLFTFGIALRIFLNGHHLVALLILIAVWAVLAVWLKFGGVK